MLNSPTHRILLVALLLWPRFRLLRCRSPLLKYAAKVSMLQDHRRQSRTSSTNATTYAIFSPVRDSLSRSALSIPPSLLPRPRG